MRKEFILQSCELGGAKFACIGARIGSIVCANEGANCTWSGATMVQIASGVVQKMVQIAPWMEQKTVLTAFWMVQKFKEKVAQVRCNLHTCLHLHGAKVGAHEVQVSHALAQMR